MFIRDRQKGGKVGAPTTDAVAKLCAALDSFKEKLDINPRDAWLTCIMQMSDDDMQERINFTSNGMNARMRKIAMNLFKQRGDVHSLIDAGQDTIQYAETLVQSGTWFGGLFPGRCFLG